MTHHRSAATHSACTLALALSATAFGQAVDPAGAAPDPAADAAANPIDAAPRAEWPDMVRPDDWTLQVTPRIWLVSPSGRIKLPSNGPAGSKIRVEDLNLDHPRVEPFGQLDLKLGDFRISFSGFNNSLNESGGSGAGFQLGNTIVAPGGAFNTSLDFTSLQIQLGYRVWSYDFGAEGGDAPDRTVLWLDVLAGGRYYDVDIDFSSAGTTTSVDETFAELFAGAHVELQVARDFSVEAELTGGGWSASDHSVLSIDVALAFTWRPVDAVGLQIGWRQLAFDLADGAGAGEFEYTGRLAGLFLGLTIRF
ncbi:MAG: hypothetical protein AB7K52_06985 [Phycisphaerales bacterium]